MRLLDISFVTLQNFVPWIHVTSTDFDALTRNRALCTERYEIEKIICVHEVIMNTFSMAKIYHFMKIGSYIFQIL